VEHNYLTKNECEFGATLDPYAIDNLETGWTFSILMVEVYLGWLAPTWP
jgi:hypothetical protein